MGSSTSYLENEECPGGPYSTESTDGYGIEVWCNIPGQYVSIVRDYSAETTFESLTICEMAIFGEEISWTIEER